MRNGPKDGGKLITRKPAVAGYFYPGDPQKVRDYVLELLQKHGTEKKEKAVGLVCPHAGWVYCGRVIAKTVGTTKIPERVLVLCPNHTGEGAEISLFPQGVWIFPGFEVMIDDELFELLAPYCEIDTGAHISEHSAEVIIPFLYYSNPSVRIAVVCLRTLDTDKLKKLAEGVLNARQKLDFLVVASSDMNHYESDEVSRQKDSIALEKVRELDADGLFDVALRHHITMCGLPAVYTLLAYAREVGAKSADVVEYTNSAEVTGDFTSVVGYAGVRVV